MADAAVNPNLPLIAVTGSQRPYIYDLPHVLSLPVGFEFRFRYRHMWVQDEVSARVQTEPQGFQGKDLILLFHSQERKRIVPIRKCKVIGIESIGPLVFLRFSVGAFPGVDAAPLMNPDWVVAEAAAETLGQLGLALLGAVAPPPIDLLGYSTLSLRYSTLYFGYSTENVRHSTLCLGHSKARMTPITLINFA